MSVTLYGSGQTIIQSVTTSSTTQFSTSSASFVNSGLSATITPQSTTSKILVLFSGNIYNSGGTVGTIYRNGSNIGTANGFLRMTVTNANDYTQSMIVLDSPSTTSATTYSVYLLASSGSTYLSINNTGYSLTLLEISGS